MTEIKWIKGNEVEPYRPYDYPDGYSTYQTGCSLLDDLYCHKVLGKWEWEEVKKKIPKKLHRRRWIVGVATFSGEKGSIEIRVTDGDYIPIRTHNWIMKNDKYLKKNIIAYRGG